MLLSPSLHHPFFCQLQVLSSVISSAPSAPCWLTVQFKLRVAGLCAASALLISYMQTTESAEFPCCKGAHTSLPIPAADIIVKVMGSLLLHCSSCQVVVELRHLKAHHDSGCQATFRSPLSSQQTVEEILTQPLDAPPTATEKKLATSLIRRMMNDHSTTTTGSCSMVSLPTGGQVSLNYKGRRYYM